MLNTILLKFLHQSRGSVKLLICISFAPSFTAAVSEMLVQSSMTDLYLLPALPRDKWPNGCVKGLKARSDVTVSICWKEGELHEVGLWSKDHDTKMRLHYQMITMTANIMSGRVYTFNKELKCVKSNAMPNCISS